MNRKWDQGLFGSKNQSGLARSEIGFSVQRSQYKFTRSSYTMACENIFSVVQCEGLCSKIRLKCCSLNRKWDQGLFGSKNQSGLTRSEIGFSVRRSQYKFTPSSYTMACENIFSVVQCEGLCSKIRLK